jgi:polyphosphate kinase
LRGRILHEILEVHLRDNTQARKLLSDGTYEKLRPDNGNPPLNSQEWMMANWRGGS